MPESKASFVLVVACRRAKAPASKLLALLEARGIATQVFPDEDAQEASSRALASIASIAKNASAIVVVADQALAKGAAIDADDLQKALRPFSSKTTLLIAEPQALDILTMRSADIVPGRGALADLPKEQQDDLLARVTEELVIEIDQAFEPAKADHFEEYRLLFESTERLVEQRRQSGQTFIGANAALTAVVGFLAKDLGFQGARLALITLPLFLIGMLVCRLWQRTILQYEALIAWRYRQLRRIERTRFVGSYRLFGREWDAIYAPSRRRSFGFSNLEAAMPRLFFYLHLLGLLGAIALALPSTAALLERLRF